MSDDHGKGWRPTALDPPMVPLCIAGIVIWAVAALVLLPFRGTHGSWLAICVAGFVWGFLGLVTMIRHDAGRRRRHATDDQASSISPSS